MERWLRQSWVSAWVEQQRAAKAWEAPGMLQLCHRSWGAWLQSIMLDQVEKTRAPSGFLGEAGYESKPWRTSEPPPPNLPSVWCRFAGLWTSEPVRTILMTSGGWYGVDTCGRFGDPHWRFPNLHNHAHIRQLATMVHIVILYIMSISHTRWYNW